MEPGNRNDLPTEDEVDPAPEALPGRAPSPVRLEVEIARAGRTSSRVLEVPPGTLVRTVLRQLQLAPEGSAVMIGGVSVPLDTPVETPLKLLVVPTFSGG